MTRPAAPGAVVLGLVVALLGARSLQRWDDASRSYPYYFAFDMDLLNSVETLVMQEGGLPNQVHHTSFGMYLVLGGTQRWAHARGELSALTLGDLEASLNPLAVMAEHTEHQRRQSPYLCLVLVLSLWGALCLLLRPSLLVAALLLPLLALQDGILYQARLARSELYAAVFLGLALLAAATWARLGILRARAWLGPLMGALLSLAFLTKLQSLPCLLSAPLLLAWADDLGAPEEQPPRAPLVLGLVGLVGFVGLLGAAWVAPVPAGAATYTDRYGVSALALAVGGGLLGALGLQLAGRAWAPACQRTRELLRHGRAWADHLAFVSVGALGAFLLHLLVYPDPVQGGRYLLLDARMAFLRPFAALQGGEAAGSPGSTAGLGSVLAYQPSVYLALVSLGAGLLLTWSRGLSRTQPRHLGAFGALLALLAVQTALATRPLLRDLIWLDLLTCLPLGLGLLHLIGRGRRRRRLQVSACAALFAFLLLAEGRRAAAIPTRTDVVHQTYGWSPWRWLFGWDQGTNHARYRELMNGRYGVEQAVAGLEAAGTGARDLHDARFVLANLELDLRRIGPLEEGFPLWTADPATRLVRVPPVLSGARVVDAGDCPARPQRIPRGVDLPRYDELPAPRDLPPDRWVQLLPRPDLSLFLFASSPDAERLLAAAGGALSGTSLRLLAAGPAGSHELQGLLVRRAWDLPRHRVQAPWCAVLTYPRRPPSPGRPALPEGLDDVRSDLALVTSQARPALSRRMASALRGSRSRWERLWAASALGSLGPDQEPATSALLEALRDEDPAVRREAARSLAGVDSPRVRRALEGD